MAIILTRKNLKKRKNGKTDKNLLSSNSLAFNSASEQAECGKQTIDDTKLSLSVFDDQHEIRPLSDC